MTNDRFRKAVKLDFKGEDIRAKKELEILMRNYKYRVFDQEGKRGGPFKANPTQDQMDSAWEYIKSGFSEKKYVSKVYERRERYAPINKSSTVVSIKLRGFKKRQLRDRRTGKIVGWE